MYWWRFQFWKSICLLRQALLTWMTKSKRLRKKIQVVSVPLINTHILNWHLNSHRHLCSLFFRKESLSPCFSLLSLSSTVYADRFVLHYTNIKRIYDIHVVELISLIHPFGSPNLQKRFREDNQYTCGDALPAECGIFVRESLTCISDVEINYYSSTMCHFVPPCCFLLWRCRKFNRRCWWVHSKPTWTLLCVLVKVSVLTKAFVFLDNLCLQSMNDKIQKIRPQVKKKNTSCFSAFNQHTHFKLTFEYYAPFCSTLLFFIVEIPKI
jgi:hypothetical protein